MIWEYRTGYNVFYDLTTRALPGFFEAPLYASSFDELGRREVVGPTELGLEAVAILSMAFPIAIVGIMHAKRWRGRILYGLAVCILGLAMLSTYRKSALLAPVTVGLALAYFRPRQALKLAPLAAVVIAVMAIASFSAFQSVTGQFETDRLDVGTVNDRVADYDAVRPDFLSHPALGQGFGSYETLQRPRRQPDPRLRAAAAGGRDRDHRPRRLPAHDRHGDRGRGPHPAEGRSAASATRRSRSGLRPPPSSASPRCSTSGRSRTRSTSS